MQTDFPDDIFQNETPNYNYIVNMGAKICKNKNIIFCGIARDVAENLQLNIDRLHRTGRLLNNYKIFIYENDSTDQTKTILEKNQSNNFIYITETREDQDYKLKLNTKQDPWHYNRCQVLSKCRNKYIEYISALKDKPDYVCVLDWDLKGGWSYKGFIHAIFTLEQDIKNGCVSAYGVLSDKYGKDTLEQNNPNKYIMYDSFAFRPLQYINRALHMIKTPLFNNLCFRKDMEPLQVCSNFGGMSIYKIEAFIDGKEYSAKNWGNDSSGFIDPDHVNFHRNMISKNWKILLDPAFIVSYSHHKFSRGII